MIDEKLARTFSNVLNLLTDCQKERLSDRDVSRILSFMHELEVCHAWAG